MNQNKQEFPEDVRLVRTLMVLRNLTVDKVSTNTGVQQENFSAWLNGTASALSHKSYLSILSYFGLTRDGFSDAFIQHWSMNVYSSFSDSQKAVLGAVSTWLKSAVMVELIGGVQPFYGKRRIFAIRNDNVKILFAVHGGFKIPSTLLFDMLPGVAYRSTEDNRSHEIDIDDLYWNAICSQSVTAAEFDDIFFETAKACSWNDLRLMARERSITPAMLAGNILAKEVADYEASMANTETSKVAVGKAPKVMPEPFVNVVLSEGVYPSVKESLPTNVTETQYAAAQVQTMTVPLRTSRTSRDSVTSLAKVVPEVVTTPVVQRLRRY